MRIPIFTDERDAQGGWHGAALAQAFAARGVEAVFVNLQDCAIDLTGESAQMLIPNFSELPPAAFVRGIAGGTLQQVITRLNILHMLSLLGVRVYNNGRAIERTVDKAMTSFLLKQAGIATPATWVGESRADAHAWMQAEIAQYGSVVIKPLFGSQGKGVRLIEPHQAKPVPMDVHIDGVFYLQHHIKTAKPNHDYRVFVIGNKAIATMRRSGVGWLNNVAQGARCEMVEDIAVSTIAVQAALALDIDYCGVDVIRDVDGKLWVLEVNSIPAWRGLQQVSSVNVAQMLADDVIKKMV